jgi:hypothetical protein
MTTRPGEKVLVPTEVESGAFPGEKLVTLETQSGPVSGFAKTDTIIEQSVGKYYLPAEVKEVTQRTLTVLLLSGSFFTTTGLAEVPIEKVLKATG